MIEDFPEEAKFLTPAEKAHVVRRLREDTGAAGSFKWAYVLDAFKDWKTYVFALMCESSSRLSDSCCYLLVHVKGHAR